MVQTNVIVESRAAFDQPSCKALCTLSASAQMLIFFVLVQNPNDFSAPTWTLHQNEL